MNNLEFIVFYFSFYLIGRKLFLYLTKKNNRSALLIDTEPNVFYPLFGVMFLSALVFLGNFFLPLSLYKNIILGFLSLMILSNIRDFKNFKNIQNKGLFIWNYLVTPAIISISSYNIKFHYDAEVYHLASQAWIINSKIVFGLSKYFIWLGHSSIYEYLQSFLQFEGNFIYQHYLTILFITLFFNFLSFHLILWKNTLISNISLFILVFGILDNFGLGGGSNGFIQIQMVGKPDIAVGVLFFLTTLTIIYGTTVTKPTHLEYYFLLSLIIFITQLRNLAVVLIIFLLPYFIKNYKLIKNLIFTKFSLFLILYNFLWVIKNVIVSSCILFPVKISCINQLPWNISSQLDKIQNWEYSYKFDEPIQVFFKDWFDLGYNSTQVPNLLTSLFLLYIVRLLLFKKSKITFKYINVYIFLIFCLFLALYFTFHIRYWYGLIILFVSIFGFNVEIKSKYHLITSKYFIGILLLILFVGFPRGYSYSYFLHNMNYYSLTIDYTKFQYSENKFGYGVIAENKRCFDSHECSTFQLRKDTNIELSKFLGSYHIFQ